MPQVVQNCSGTTTILYYLRTYTHRYTNTQTHLSIPIVSDLRSCQSREYEKEHENENRKMKRKGMEKRKEYERTGRS